MEAGKSNCRSLVSTLTKKIREKFDSLKFLLLEIPSEVIQKCLQLRVGSNIASAKKWQER